MAASLSRYCNWVLVKNRMRKNTLPSAIHTSANCSAECSTLRHLASNVKSVTLTWSVTIDDDIVAGIVRVAEEGEEVEGAGVLGKSDVIAIATHGYGGLDQWAMGSITERVLQVTSLPLLIVRPARDDRDGQLK